MKVAGTACLITEIKNEEHLQIFAVIAFLEILDIWD